MSSVTPDELARRCAPILPLLQEQLASMDEEGAIILLDKNKAAAMLGGFAIALIEKTQDGALPFETMIRG